ncbi:MAG: hypothetical protein V1778_00040 [bacterium]
MNILVVCHWGRNRSKYVAEYLRTKGYATDFAGILDETENQVTPTRMRWAEKILVVEPSIAKELKRQFPEEKNKIVSINVDDRTARPGVAGLTGDEWTRHQEEVVYPNLLQAVDRLLPFR